MEKTDVVIAGAGIAGCLAARDIAKAGYKVILVERMAAENLGHHWWDSVEAVVFKEVGLPDPEPPERMNPTGSVRLISPLETSEFTSGALSFKPNIDRRLLAKRLLGYAREAGAIILDSTSVLGPIVNNGKVEGISVCPRGGQPFDIHAKLSFETTGFSSAIRKKLPDYWGFPRYFNRTDTFVTYREIRENTDDSKDQILIFGKNNGVHWVKRAQPGYVDFFAGCINAPGRPSPRAMVKELMSNHSGHGKLLLGGYGAPIPVRREFNSLVMPGLIICGDAGCTCSPIDGSGIVSSLRAAHHAAKTAISALQQERYDEAALWAYNTAYKRTQGAKFAKLDMLQKFMVTSTPPLLELLFTRKIITDAQMRQDDQAPKESKSAKLKQVLRLADHPRFMMRLIRVSLASEKLAKHYGEFPETFDMPQYQLWQDKTDKLFNASTRP